MESLRVSDKEIASRPGVSIKVFHQFLASNIVKINHYIAAEDQIKLPLEGKIIAFQVEQSERDQVAYLLHNLEIGW